jgi:hypothetical protein
MVTRDPYWLDKQVEFDCAFEVTADGKVVERPDVWAPSLLDDQLDTEGWELLDGYSGQDRYAGPIMHSSEFLGGRMADDIVATPGVYVVIAAYWSPEEGDENAELDVEGWAVARQL